MMMQTITDAANGIENLARKYPYVTGIDLAKNCGQHNAILAGMKYAKGDYILGMDDDFQTHPSHIYKLTDNFFRFWYSFVFPNLSELESGDANGIWE